MRGARRLNRVNHGVFRIDASGLTAQHHVINANVNVRAGSRVSLARDANGEVGAIFEIFQSLRGFVQRASPSAGHGGLLVPAARYALAAALIAVLSVALLGPLVTSLIEDWSRRDIEMRAALVSNSIGDALSNMLERKDDAAITALFERVDDVTGG